MSTRVAIGGALTVADLAAHTQLGITPELLEAAGVRRVTDRQAREDCGLTYGATDLSGVCYPRIDPWFGRPVGYRVRVDHPDVRDGKPQAKYISSPDRAHPYFVPGTTPEMLADAQIPIVIVEAEKSGLAIMGAAGCPEDHPDRARRVLGMVWADWQDHGRGRDARR